MFSILDEVYGWIVSMRYTGYLCFRILYALKPILNCTLYLTGRQRSFFLVGMIWEYLDE